MNKDDYLDKKIPDEAIQPDWLDTYQDTTEEMHRLDAEWQQVYKKTKEYLRVLTGDKK